MKTIIDSTESKFIYMMILNNNFIFLYLWTHKHYLKSYDFLAYLNEQTVILREIVF